MSEALDGNDVPLPDFFIVGAPKCGTTSMARYLTAHPELFVLRGEPHFFGSDIDYNRPRLTPRQYRALCRSAGRQRVGDRSTWYLYSERAADEIHRARPDARIIAMLRDPAEMIHSLHAHHVQRGRRDDCVDLADALAREPKRRRGLAVPATARFPESLLYTSIPRYAEQLERYIRRFGRERVHVVVFDDLKSDPAAVHRRVLDFLGAAPGPAIDYRIHNRAGPAPDDWLHRAWKRSTLRYRVRSVVPEGLYGWLRRHRPGGSVRPHSAPKVAPLEARLRAELDARFLPEVLRLEKLLDRPLPGWARTARRPHGRAPATARASLPGNTATATGRREVVG
ncbi:sulfotransferase family protein [Halomonas denitrificans]|nr:sulfotransferase [Halomonas denitrificans]